MFVSSSYRCSHPNRHRPIIPTKNARRATEIFPIMYLRSSRISFFRISVATRTRAPKFRSRIPSGSAFRLRVRAIRKVRHFSPVEARGSKSRVRLQGVTLVRTLEPPRFPPYCRHSASCTHARRKSTLAVSRRCLVYTCIYMCMPPLENRGSVHGWVDVRAPRVHTWERDWRHERA